MSAWTMPDLTGATAVVTGANTGIGLPTAAGLARHGAHVVVASRDEGKGRQAVARIQAGLPGARAEFERLDLADLASVRAFADAIAGRFDGLDLLINNAGIGMIPRARTADGFEMQFGVNHLGHFALTGRLLPLLLARPGARVVTVSSDVHKAGRIDFDDLDMAKKYGRIAAYARSKLANLMFTLELQRRADAAGARLLSLAGHPGATATGLIKIPLVNRLFRLLLQPPGKGAVPILYAATAPGVVGGGFYGPGPKALTPSAAARDEAAAGRLWDVSAELTGVPFEFEQHAPRP